MNGSSGLELGPPVLPTATACLENGQHKPHYWVAHFEGLQALAGDLRIYIFLPPKLSPRFEIPQPTTGQRPSTTANMSAPSLNKIAANSPSRQNPSELESSIAGALHDLETGTADLKVALRPLQFVSAREV